MRDAPARAGVGNGKHRYPANGVADPSGGSWDEPSGDTYRALRKRYPGSFAWWQANLTWLVVGVTVVGILGGCFVYLYATGQVG